MACIKNGFIVILVTKFIVVILVTKFIEGSMVINRKYKLGISLQN